MQLSLGGQVDRGEKNIQCVYVSYVCVPFYSCKMYVRRGIITWKILVYGGKKTKYLRKRKFLETE